MSPSFLFSLQPTSGVPIYRQIIDQVKLLSASGRLKPGHYLPTVRQVAHEMSVNPMTVSKAYSMLETAGVVEHMRGQGMRLSEVQAPLSQRERLEELRPLVEQLATRARQLDLETSQVVELVERACGKLSHG